MVQLPPAATRKKLLTENTLSGLPEDTCIHIQMFAALPLLGKEAYSKGITKTQEV